MRIRLLVSFCWVCGALGGGAVPSAAAEPAAGSQPAATTQPVKPEDRRPFDPTLGGRWVGNAISYGPHRDGQTPGGASPSREQLREDLGILRQHWSMLRMYSSQGSAETVLQLIREERIPMKVMLGAWIAAEVRLGDDGAVLEEFPQARAANRREVAAAIRLANAYPDLVCAVSVGNETQVFWSGHKVPLLTLVDYIRQVRTQTQVAVTAADDFNFWNKPESRQVAAEIDFIVTHIYAMWAKQPLDRALPFTQEKYAEVSAMHPGRLIVIGEAGWATRKHAAGEQGDLIRGEAGEEPQKTYYSQFIAWTTRERIVNFYFEAFDENWKGGAEPDEVEKHWGLFRADRTPKPAVAAVRTQGQ